MNIPTESKEYCVYCRPVPGGGKPIKTGSSRRGPLFAGKDLRFGIWLAPDGAVPCRDGIMGGGPLNN